MKSIYNLIKEEVRRHPIIKNSILATSINWKRSHYIILAELISEELSEKEELRNEKRFELGTSISHITLQRFFESDYDYKTHNDLRFIKTLDKICIFLGFKNLNSFVKSVRGKNSYDESKLGQEFATDIVYNYCKTNFEFFRYFPLLKLELFDKLIFEQSPFRERIKNYSSKLCERNLKLLTKNNRSNFEIFDIDIISEEADKIVLKTQEFWNLVFIIEDSGNDYVINELNTQIYFIKKINNIWKIWDNYNPNSGLLNNVIAKKP
ncbi:hypothetical protein [Epilithonimonas vandammei]|uniref:Uncharacterized protein n=1 Tax=Epilithonimonas vandammei TaxID=2487072 RepID=A0A3G8Y1X8_9FLAO|nr:hypothetical protein [Epilithonimonas vandammei]AZI39375.1 hypothetical protein EIB74_05080 [Epilithonimonas vandammei]